MEYYLFSILIYFACQVGSWHFFFFFSFIACKLKRVELQAKTPPACKIPSYASNLVLFHMYFDFYDNVQNHLSLSKLYGMKSQGGLDLPHG